MENVPVREIGDRVRPMNVPSVPEEYRGLIGTVVAHDMAQEEFRRYLVKLEILGERVWFVGTEIQGAA